MHNMFTEYLPAEQYEVQYLILYNNFIKVFAARCCNKFLEYFQCNALIFQFSY